MDPFLHQPPLASHHCLYIYLLYLSEKGNYVFRVFSFAYLFFYFFGFHLFPLESFPAITSSQREHSPCLGSHLPGLSPAWPPLSPSSSLLSRAITLVPGEQVKCFACLLPLHPLPAAFCSKPLLRTFPGVQPVQFSMVPSPGSGMASCTWLHRKGPAFRTWREGAHAILSQDDSYATRPPNQDR